MEPWVPWVVVFLVVWWMAARRRNRKARRRAAKGDYLDTLVLEAPGCTWAVRDLVQGCLIL